MAWTATIGTPTQDPAGIAIPVTFNSDSGAVKSDLLRFITETPDQVQAAIQSELDKLTAQDALLAQVTPGAFSPIQPSQDDQNQAAYQAALAIQQQIQQAVTSGAVASDDPLVTDAAANVAAAWGLVSGDFQTQVQNQTQTIQTQNNLKKGGTVAQGT